VASVNPKRLIDQQEPLLVAKGSRQSANTTPGGVFCRSFGSAFLCGIHVTRGKLHIGRNLLPAGAPTPVGSVLPLGSFLSPLASTGLVGGGFLLRRQKPYVVPD